MKKVDWKAQLKRDAKFASSVLLSQGSFTPMFMLHCPDGVRVLGSGWEDATQKRVVQHVVSLMALAENAHAIGFISEAWVRNVAKRHGETEAEFIERCNAVAPSQAEDRVEALIVALTYRQNNERHNLGCSMEILRGADGEVTGTVELPGMGIQEGAMVELLCPVEVNANIRAKAAEALKNFCGMTGFTLEAQEVFNA